MQVPPTHTTLLYWGAMKDLLLDVVLCKAEGKQKASTI